MCFNLKFFNESFRDWNQKGEEEQFCRTADAVV